MSESQTFYNASPNAQGSSSSHTACTILWILVVGLAVYLIVSMCCRKPAVGLEQQTMPHIVEGKDMGAFLEKGNKRCLFVFAEWCGHCQACKADYDALAKIDGVEIAKYDGGKGEQSPMELLMKKVGKIEGFPCFFCLNEKNEVVAKKVGAFSKDKKGNMLQNMTDFVNNAFK